MVLLIMTLLAALGAPLAAFIMGGGTPASITPPTVENSAGQPSEPAESEQPDSGAPTPKPDFVLATFNVLGNSHTTESGKEPELDPGTRRMRRALRLLNAAEADVVGLQELQKPQAHALEALEGDSWRLFHSAGDSENAIAWRRGSWAAVRTRTIGVPYFDGNERRMPLVLLRHKETGVKVWFFNVHNPANTDRFPDQADYRAAATAIEIDLLNRLARGKTPVVFMGDLNDRQGAFCDFTESGSYAAATGETREDPCQDPAYNGIDWIFGTLDLIFTNWTVRTEGVVGITSDHPLVTVSVGLPG